LGGLFCFGLGCFGLGWGRWGEVAAALPCQMFLQQLLSLIVILPENRLNESLNRVSIITKIYLSRRQKLNEKNPVFYQSSALRTLNTIANANERKCGI
jgi:hypothetical protein